MHPCWQSKSVINQEWANTSHKLITVVQSSTKMNSLSSQLLQGMSFVVFFYAVHWILFVH